MSTHQYPFNLQIIFRWRVINIPRGNKYQTDPKMLEVLLNAHRPLSVSELGTISGMGRDKARSFADRIILGTAGVQAPVKIVDILMSRINSAAHFRFIGIKDADYWNDWLQSVTEQGYRIARDHHGIFPFRQNVDIDFDPVILEIVRKNLSNLAIMAQKYKVSPTKLLELILAFGLHSNFMRVRSLLNIINEAKKSTNPNEQWAANKFLSQAGFQASLNQEGS